MAGRPLPRALIEHIPQLMRRSYDRIAPLYNRGRDKRRDWTSWKRSWEDRVVYSRFVRRLPPGGRVLDLGCGVGVWLKQFRANRFRVAGIDQSPRMVAFSRRRNPGAPVFCRDMRRPGFTAGSFDGILSMFAVIHVPQGDQPEVFRHMHRLLKPGGHFLINIGGGAYEYVGEHHGEWLYWSGAPLAETFRRIRRAGFKIIWHRGLGPRADPHEWILARKPHGSGRPGAPPATASGALLASSSR